MSVRAGFPEDQPGFAICAAPRQCRPGGSGRSTPDRLRPQPEARSMSDHSPRHLCGCAASTPSEHWPTAGTSSATDRTPTLSSPSAPRFRFVTELRDPLDHPEERRVSGSGVRFRGRRRRPGSKRLRRTSASLPDSASGSLLPFPPAHGFRSSTGTSCRQGVARPVAAEDLGDPDRALKPPGNPESSPIPGFLHELTDPACRVRFTQERQRPDDRRSARHLRLEPIQTTTALAGCAGAAGVRSCPVRLFDRRE